MFSRGAGATRATLARGDVEQIAVRLVTKPAVTRSFVFASWQELPQAIRDSAAAQGAQPEEVRAIHWRGKTYLVDGRFANAREVEKAIFHEHYAHYGLRRRYGKDLERKMKGMLMRVGGVRGLLQMAESQGINLGHYIAGVQLDGRLTASQRGAILMDELLAHMAEATGTLRQTIQEWFGAVRNWMREHGFAELSKLNAADLSYELRLAREAAQEADTQANDIPVFQRTDTEASAQAEGQRQFEETEKAYGGRTAYDKAKASGKTKLNYRQWVQVRTPAFKEWFGDWEALRAQERLDSMEPLQVRVPGEWRDLPIDELRQRVEDSLLQLMRSGEPLSHPEAGEVSVVRKGIKKALASSADPAKLQMLGDLRRAFESSFFAGTQPARGAAGNVLAYDKLLARLEVGDSEVVAVFTVRRLTDGSQFYNTVTLDDSQKKTPVASPRGTPIAGERATSANTGVNSFIRRPLARVNPDAVSKVTDPETGEPLVVYHTTTESFTTFKKGERAGLSGKGIYFAVPGEGVPSHGSNRIDAFLNIRNPITREIANDEKYHGINGNGTRRVDPDVFANFPEFDGVMIRRDEITVKKPNQIKSSTGNVGTFSGATDDIRFSRIGDAMSAGASRAAAAADRLTNRKREIPPGFTIPLHTASAWCS